MSLAPPLSHRLVASKSANGGFIGIETDMRQGRILVVEDDDILRSVTQMHLTKKGCSTAAAADAIEALRILEDEPQDLVICDIQLPGLSGLDLLKNIRVRYAGTEVVVITGFGTVVTAVEAMKSGAYDYLTKPIHLYDLSALVDRVLERIRLIEEVRLLRINIDHKFGFDKVIGRSKSFLDVVDQAVRVAPSSATVLIQGETGTGKEVLAKSIHFNSRRRERPFVTINCAAIPRDLVESELFGHSRGAFTGAVAHKKGRVEMADSGTLFLDEVGELPLEVQVRFLRLIQEREIEKIGGLHPAKVDVRIIAATNRNLEAQVAAGGFREDLYYRLAVVPIELPPLRNRAEDIPYFVQYFFEASKQRYGKPELSLPPNVVSYFSAYDWPGNIRQLENAIEYIVVLSRSDQVTLNDLPEFLRPVKRQLDHPSAQSIEGMSLATVEKDLIVRALRQFSWNQSRAAKYLGITRRTLMYRIAKYGIEESADQVPLSSIVPLILTGT
jgi:DNA-binding NtrC family response regulator